MSNTINLASKYVGLLDEKYSKETISAILDTPDTIVQEGKKADTIYLPEMSFSTGLQDYDRNTGFSSADTNLSWTSYTLSNDRGVQFEIDRMDNTESVGVIMANIAGEFVKNKVAPEVDAYRFSKIYSNIDAGMTTQETLSSSNDIDVKIDNAIQALDDAEVPESDRHLFIRNDVYSWLKEDISRTLSTETGVQRDIETFDGMPVHKVPESRFWGNVSIDSGGGYSKSDSGTMDVEYIQFMVVHAPSMFPLAKVQKPRIFEPSENQNADAWKFDYRMYHDLFVPTNKTEGAFVNYETRDES